MELQELVERIQRWKERTSPEQIESYNPDDIVEDVAPTEDISDALSAGLMDNDLVEEVSEVDFVEGSMEPSDVMEEDEGKSDF
jgi:hypothetical protein